MAEQKTYNDIVIVDENGVDIGSMSYPDAIAQGVIRSAARVMIRNEYGEFLLSRRSKYISKPLLLDNSAAGHRDVGETYYETAVRELQEELGISGVKLQEVVSVAKGLDFFYSLYLLELPKMTHFALDPHEVAEIIWYTPEAIDELVTNAPETCSPDFVDMWQQHRAELVQ